MVFAIMPVSLIKEKSAVADLRAASSFLSSCLNTLSAWKVTVNGKKTEALAIYDSLTYIPLDKTEGANGCHIRMKYVSRGFIQGIVISLAGLVIFVFIAISERKRAKS